MVANMCLRPSPSSQSEMEIRTLSLPYTAPRSLGFRCAVVFTALAAALVAFLRPWHFLMFEAGWWRCSCSPLVTSTAFECLTNAHNYS